MVTRMSRVEEKQAMKSIAGERTAGAKYGVLPGPKQLQEMRDRGMTHREIAAEVEKKTGYRVTRESVSMALKRAGLQGKVRRYSELIPWTVRDRHARHYALAMLRAEARRRRGLEMSDDLAHRLESWKDRLSAEGLVVYYEPESPEGFYYIERNEDDEDIIRRPERIETPERGGRPGRRTPYSGDTKSEIERKREKRIAEAMASDAEGRQR